MALLFAQEDAPDDMDLGREAWAASEPEKNKDEDDSTSGQPPPPPSGKPRGEPITAETLADFKRQLQGILQALARPSFAETCTPARMVDALAYPLFLSLSAAEAGWLLPSDAAVIATRVTEVMLNQPYGRDKPRGLLHMVRQRHDAAGRLEEFHRATGDGTLWTVLLASLTPNPESPPAVLLPQAAALIAVLQCRDLLAGTDVSRLSSLVRSVRVRNAETHITERAPQDRRGRVLPHGHPVRPVGCALP
jgi:hypothetical protein